MYNFNHFSDYLSLSSLLSILSKIASINASKLARYSPNHLRLNLDAKYAIAPAPIPITVVLNAIVIALASVVTSPVPNAARPDPLGLKFPSIQGSDQSW